MNKKDLASLRRRFAPDKNDISIIRGCFVNEKREIVSTFSKSPVSLPESEAEHYLSAFKKTLGGAPGRNQFSIPVHTDNCLSPANGADCQSTPPVGDQYLSISLFTRFIG